MEYLRPAVDVPQRARPFSLQGKNKRFSAAKGTNGKRIFRVLGFAAAAMLGCALISSQVVAQSPPPASFQSASLLTFSDSRCDAESLATGDFNGDGKPDLVVIGGACTTTADIFLGNGNGTFSLSQAISPLNGSLGAHNAHVVAVGDFNGDGHLDFAVALQGGSSGILDVYLGDGTGHFNYSATYSYGSRNGGQGSIAVADVNGDGKLDLIVGNGFYDGTITVMLGNGDGTFSPQTPFVCCQNNQSWDVMDVAVADFNNDGHPDIAVADQAGGIDILLNKGDGTFQPPVFYSEPGGGAFPNNESGIAAADLSHDGNQDVVLTWNGGFWVYLGKGDGTFSTPVNYSTPCGAYAGCYGSSVAVADINGDNKLDVIMPDVFASTVWVSLGNGDGTFQPGTGYATDFFPQSIVIADFNGDGKPDFAVGNDDDDQVTIALGNGDGTFRAGANYDPINPYASSGEVAADFNNDGYLDVATWGSDGHNDFIRVMLNNSHGVLGTPIVTTVFGCCTQSIADIKAGDVNGDGKVDLVGVISETSPQIGVFLGNGNGAFEAPVFYPTGSSQVPYGIALADLRNNGNLDVLVSNDDGSLSVLLNNGDGTFGTGTVIPSVSGNYGGMIVSGDFNGDGKIDLAIRDSKDSSINILLGYGDGSFQSPMMVPVAYGPEGIAVGDFNQDGKLDLATAGYGIGQTLFSGGGLAVMLGNGNGTFSTPTYYSFYPGYCCGGNFPTDPNLPVVADVNLDGIPDLLVTFATSTHVGPPGTCCYPTNNIGIAVMLGKGDGTFEFENPLGEPGITGGPFLVGTGSSDLVAGDFNGDGAPDAAVLNYSSASNSYSSYVTMLLNTTTGSGTCTTTTLASSANPAAYGQAVMLIATVAACEGSPPTGPVTFFDGGIQIGTATLSGGQATLTTSTLGVGLHSITAIFGGNGSFKPSASAPLTEVVSSAPQAAAPTFSEGTGTYTGTQSITLSTTAGTVICYNTSGAAMTVGSGCTGGTQYTGTAVTVSSSETLYAVAGGPGYTQSSVTSATYTINFYFTLILTELGNGTGTVTDNTSQINCSEANGIYTSSACSGTYLTGTPVVLTESIAGSPTGTAFGGWGSVCASSGTGTTCSLTASVPSALNATANFIAPPIQVTLTSFATPGTNVSGQATFACPNNPNPTPSTPCTDPSGHALQLTIPQVTTGMNVVVTETEFLADGLCPASQVSLGGKSTDFDCRFVSFYNYGTDRNGNVIVPLCDPYANGNCVSYRVSQPDGTELPAGDYNGGIFWKITFNNDTYTPTGYWLGSTPRMLDDPGADEVPPLPYGTSCNTAMQTDNSTLYPGPYYCQFDNDITTFYNAAEPVDSGIGGKTSQPNDVVIAFLPTSTGTGNHQTPPSNSAPTFTSSTSAPFLVGTYGYFAVTTTGYPAPVLSLTSGPACTALTGPITVAPGVTIDCSSGLISGTPTAGGSYPISLTATNIAGSVPQSFTLLVNIQAVAPTFSEGTGTYTGIQSITMSTTAGTVICYNTSGAAMTVGAGCTGGTQYTGTAVAVSSSETLYAVAGGPGYTQSSVNSATYTIKAAALKVTPTSLNFGQLYLGQPGIPQFVTVTNTGSTSAVISSVSITGGNAPSDYGDLSFCRPWFSKPPGTLPAGKSCVIGVDAIFVFAPIFSPTPATANLTITPSGGSPLVVPLTVLVINPQATFSSTYLSSGKLTFPTTPKGKSNAQSITVTNKGNTPLTIVGTPAISSSSGDFVLTSTTCTNATVYTAAEGGVQSCVINITFTPKATGTFTGTLKIRDNAENSPQTITLSGTT